jgi:WD repeat-containing protein 68
LEHSTVLYETDNNPLLKLAWNKLDSNYLAVLEMDDKNVTLIDIRYLFSLFIYIYIFIYIFLK